jgi:hypothetical protein
MTLAERGCVSGFFGSDVDSFRTTANVRDKTRGWLDHARRAYSHEDRAFVECARDAIQLERHFAKPADVRSNATSAVAAGKLGWRIVGGCVVKWRSGASIAAAFKQFAVHVDNAY